MLLYRIPCRGHLRPLALRSVQTISKHNNTTTLGSFEDDDYEDSTMPKLVPSEMCIKLDACRKTRDFRKAQDLIQEERESIAKPFPAEDLTAALCAVVEANDDPEVVVSKSVVEILAADLAFMYVKLSERELLLAFQAGIRLNDKFAKTFSKTLIAMQDHVAKKKGKFMSSHALAGLAVLSLRREDLIRSEYFIRIAKELFERGARDSRRRKEKDGLRGLWTKAVPGSALLVFCDSYSTAIVRTGMHCEIDIFWLLLTYLRTRTQEYRLAEIAKGLRICHRRGCVSQDVVHGIIDRVIDFLRDFTARDVVAFVDAITRFGCTDDVHLTFSRVALDIAATDVDGLKRAEVATLIIGLSRFTGDRIKALDCACVQKLIRRLKEEDTGEMRNFEVVEVPKCLLRNSLLDEVLFQRYYAAACDKMCVEEMQDGNRERILSIVEVVSLLVTYSKAGFSHPKLICKLGQMLAVTGVVMGFNAAQVLAVYRAINRLKIAERSDDCFSIVLEQINRCIYQLVAVRELEVSEGLALLEAGALRLECGMVLAQYTLGRTDDEKVRHDVEKLVEAIERPP